MTRHDSDGGRPHPAADAIVGARPAVDAGRTVLSEWGRAEWRSPELRRAWLLLLTDGCARAGLTPIPSERIHRLAFFANCLAPVYDLPAPDGKVLKQARGPFYPDVQWDVDRMWVQGLLATRTGPIAVGAGSSVERSYTLTARGDAAVAVFLESPRQARAHAFLAELAEAYAALGSVRRTDAALHDLTYAEPATGTIVDFAEWTRKNASVELTGEFSRRAPAAVRLNRRDRLHLYFRYLDGVVAGPRRRTA